MTGRYESGSLTVRAVMAAFLFLWAANINASPRTNEESTPGASAVQHLIEAARTSRVNEVRELLSASVLVDGRDNNGVTALMWAASVGDLQVVKLLVKHGADAGSTGCLWDVQPFTGRKEWFGTALHAAAGHGHLEIVRYLLETGHLDVNLRESLCGDLMEGCKGEAQTTPLAEAAAGGFTAVASHLLDHGADVNTLDECGETPLIRAALAGSPETVALLLSHGAHAKVSDDLGRSTLHAAAYGGSIEVIRMLIEAGAELEARDQFGATPLHLAVSRDSKEAVRALLAAGAKTTTKDADGETPLDIARRYRLLDVVALLEPGEDGGTAAVPESEVSTSQEPEEDAFEVKMKALAAKVSDKKVDEARKTLDPEGTMTDDDIRNLLAVQEMLAGGSGSKDAEGNTEELLASLQAPEGLQTDPGAQSIDLRWDFRTDRVLGYSMELRTSGTGLLGLASPSPDRSIVLVHARGDRTADVVVEAAPESKKSADDHDPETMAELFQELVKSLRDVVGNRIQQGLQENSLFLEGTPSQRQSWLDMFPVIGKSVEPSVPHAVPRMFPFRVMGSLLLVRGTTEVRYVGDLQREGHLYALMEARTEISKIDLPDGISPPGKAWMRGRTFLVFDPSDGIVVESQGILITFMDAGFQTSSTLRFAIKRIQNENKH